jgi:hypothetical protein
MTSVVLMVMTASFTSQAGSRITYLQVQTVKKFCNKSRHSSMSYLFEPLPQV